MKNVDTVVDLLRECIDEEPNVLYCGINTTCYVISVKCTNDKYLNICWYGSMYSSCVFVKKIFTDTDDISFIDFGDSDLCTFSNNNEVRDYIINTISKNINSYDYIVVS